MDLTEKRMINDIDRRDFSEMVMEHRRKVNVLDINIKKCKDLLERLQRTSFGMLSEHTKKNIDYIPQQIHEELEIPTPSITNKNKDHQIEELYREKYFSLKEQYDTLQEGYNDLKVAVEKLLGKSNL